jgi:hypothetical protein
MSTPNARVRRGTMTTPPPRPVRDPKNPATSEPNQINVVNSRIFTVRFIAFPVSFLPPIKYGVNSSRNPGLVEKIKNPGYRLSPV